MDIDAIEASANVRMFRTLGVPACVQHPGGVSVDTRILIDRDSRVVGETTGIEESRCEIGLLIADVGEGSRGTIVDTGKRDDKWELMEPIGNDGFEHRWVAIRYDG